LRITWSFVSSICLLVQLAVFQAGCGGNGGNNGGGSGGSGGGGVGHGAAPTITSVTPAQVTTFAAPTTTIRVYGTDFTSGSVVQVNGAAITSSFQSSTELWGLPTQGQQIVNPGTYSITVNDSTGQSNALPFTVYYPRQGPMPFPALPGYYTGFEQRPFGVAVGDVNGDGRADLVVGVENDESIGSNLAVLLGQADGTLGSPRFLSGNATSSAAVGDVNGDGFPDIVAADYPPSGSPNDSTHSSIAVLLNDGAGNFTTGSTFTFTGTYPTPMVLADFEGAGRNDLVVASVTPNALYLFPNQGDGTFGQPITIAALGSDYSFTVADFNGDGKPDIAYSGLNSSGKGNTHLLLNQGGGVFSDVVPSALATVGGLIVSGDFNNDGRPDLAIQVSHQQVSVSLETYLNMGNNAFTHSSSIPLGVPGLYAPYTFAVGDFDHDGFLDITAENGGGVPGNLLMLWGKGTGDFTSQTILGPSSVHVLSGDINGDGIPDIVVPDQALAATVVLGQTSRTYAQPISIYPELAQSMWVGDVNGDGSPDLFFSGNINAQIAGSVFLNDGKGNMTLAGRPSGLASVMADLSGGGKTDLAYFNGQGSLTIWPGSGDPNFSAQPVTISVPADIGSLSTFQAVDLDGDGLPDIVGPNGIGWNKGNYQFDFEFMNMNGVFAVADVNDDGRPDLITANGTFLNQGNRQFTNIANNGVPIVDGDIAAVGDFNGDGKLDIALISPFVENIVTVAFGRGDGTFYVESILTPTDAVGVESLAGIAVGDFNGDGLDDIVVGMVPAVHAILFTSQGNGQFATSYFAIGNGTESMAKADFNMDGKPDIVILDQFDVSPSNALILFGH